MAKAKCNTETKTTNDETRRSQNKDAKERGRPRGTSYKMQNKKWKTENVLGERHEVPFHWLGSTFTTTSIIHKEASMD
jgi:hypothetical protein